MILVVHSIDYDGCLFHLGLNACQLQDDIVEKNREFLTRICERAGDARQIVFLGSNRQSLSVDLINSLFQLHGNANRPDKNYSYLDIRKVSDHLGATFDPFLLADVYSNTPDGYAYNAGYEFERQAGWSYHRIVDATTGIEHTDERLPENVSANHPWWVFDESKLTILYAQMHKVASENRNETIQFEFYDDRGDGDSGLLDPLYRYFSNYPWLIPSNVTLRLNHYYEGDVTRLRPYKEIVGQGEINPDYRATVKEMAAQVSDVQCPIEGEVEEKIAQLYTVSTQQGLMFPFLNDVYPYSLSCYSKQKEELIAQEALSAAVNLERENLAKLMQKLVVVRGETLAHYQQLTTCLTPSFPELFSETIQIMNVNEKMCLLANLMMLRNHNFLASQLTDIQNQMFSDCHRQLMTSISADEYVAQDPSYSAIKRWMSIFLKKHYVKDANLEAFFNDLHIIALHNAKLAQAIFPAAEYTACVYFPEEYRSFVENRNQESTLFSEWFKKCREPLVESTAKIVQTYVETLHDFPFSLAHVNKNEINEAFRKTEYLLSKPVISFGTPLNAAQTKLIEQAYEQKYQAMYAEYVHTMEQLCIRELSALSMDLGGYPTQDAINERINQLKATILTIIDSYSMYPVRNHHSNRVEEDLFTILDKLKTDKESALERSRKAVIELAEQEGARRILEILHRYDMVCHNQSLVKKDRELALLELGNLKWRFAALDERIVQAEKEINTRADKAIQRIREQETHEDPAHDAYRTWLRTMVAQAPGALTLLNELTELDNSYVKGDRPNLSTSKHLSDARAHAMKKATICANQELRIALVDAITRYRVMRNQSGEYRGLSFFGLLGCGFSKTTKMASLNLLQPILEGKTLPNAELLKKYRAVYCDKRLNVDYLKKAMDGCKNCPYKNVGELIDAIADGSFITYGRFPGKPMDTAVQHEQRDHQILR